MMQPPQVDPSNSVVMFAQNAKRLFDAPLREDISAHLRLILRDAIGVMIEGGRSQENRSLAGLVDQLGAGRSTVVGSRARALPQVAALINGTAGVSVELCDGNQFSNNHPSMHVLPAALAIAEEVGASGDMLLRAIFAGYEMAVRAARCTKVAEGVHPFGTTMIVGSTITAALLKGFDVPMIARAITIGAGLSIASTQNAANSGASVRNLFTGHTNAHGILATIYAAAGFCGEPTALDTVFGTILGKGFDVAKAFEDPAPYLTRNYFKLYACSRYNHAPIEAAEALITEHALVPAEIAAVTVFTYDPATRLGETSIANRYAAKHSIPFNIAARIVHRDNGAGVFTEQVVGDPVLADLARRVAVREDPAFTALLPSVRAARVEMTLVSGATVSATVERPRGGFDNPVPAAALSEKFRALVGNPEWVAQLEEAIDALPSAPNLTMLGNALSGRE